MTSTNFPNACIIGAGSSGISACKELSERNIPFDCFEIGDKIGGNWQFKNKNKMSSAYRSLHINTSRKMMEFKSFPMPDHLSDFPHHTEVAKYFEAYVDHFNLRPKIRFEHRVEKVEKLGEGLWNVDVSHNGKRFQKKYNMVIVANGHHWSPKMPDPEFPGIFSGEKFHSHHYIDSRDPIDCHGKNIVVLGMGNSAMDIACELSQRTVSNKVFLSIRRPGYVLPKYLFGKPIDALVRHPGDKPKWTEHIFPNEIKQQIYFKFLSKAINLLMGKPENYGLPTPAHPMSMTHPTISGDIHTRLVSGDIIPKPNIKNFDHDHVVFTDGSREKADIIIYATGYNIDFPFLNKNIIDPVDNNIPLFFRLFHPEHTGLAFLGLVQPLCSIIPIAELQSQWICEYLQGKYKLPSKKAMHLEAQRLHQSMKKQYVNSKRHTIQIDCTSYSFNLRKELKRGLSRAKKSQFALPPFQSIPSPSAPHASMETTH